jgi:hypothetical protein
MSAPIVTAEEVRAFLPIRPGNTSFDAKINLLINVASGQIENVINRELDRRERIQYFRTADTTRLMYDFGNSENDSGMYSSPRRVRYTLLAFNIDMTQPFKVHFDPYRQFGDDTLIPSDQYSVDTVNGFLSLQTSLYESMDGLRVTYTGGFATGSEGDMSASIPSDIKMACLSQVLYLFNRSTADNAGKDSDTSQGRNRYAGVGGGKWSVVGGVVPEAASLIARYKSFGVGSY